VVSLFHLYVDDGVGLSLAVGPAILPVRIVVHGSPVIAADIAKLMLALAGHVVAALVLLDHHPALPAPLVLEVVDQEVDLLVVAVPGVLPQQAPSAEPARTFIAYHCYLLLAIAVYFANDAFAVLRRAHLQVFVVEDQVKIMHFPVLFLDVQGELLEELAFSIEGEVAVGVGAHDLLKLVDHVDGVLVQAGLAVVAPVVAVRNEDVRGLLALLQADLAFDPFGNTPPERCPDRLAEGRELSLVALLPDSSYFLANDRPQPAGGLHLVLVLPDLQLPLALGLRGVHHLALDLLHLHLLSAQIDVRDGDL
jgi:hypothetical protein